MAQEALQEMEQPQQIPKIAVSTPKESQAREILGLLKDSRSGQSIWNLEKVISFPSQSISVSLLYFYVIILHIASNSPRRPAGRNFASSWAGPN
jgi:hypothetical protein